MRLIQIIVGILLTCMAGIYIAYHIFASPHAILKHALHIQSVPKSVKNLKMGSDVWTDEIRCFYVTIASNDFAQLLAGHDYQVFTNASLFERETMHISPKKKISGHVSYHWKTNSANCEIYPDDSHEHVLIIFAAD